MTREELCLRFYRCGMSAKQSARMAQLRNSKAFRLLESLIRQRASHQRLMRLRKRQPDMKQLEFITANGTSLEVWKQIAGFPSYEISDAGRIRRGKNILRGCPSLAGYVIVGLIQPSSGKQKFFQLHRLVALHFVAGRTEQRAIVNHINGVKTDNYAANLEWCTHQENARHFQSLRQLGSLLGRKSWFPQAAKTSV